MLKLLPIVLLLAALAGGAVYLIFFYPSGPKEVPVSLPDTPIFSPDTNASPDERIKVLEDQVITLSKKLSTTPTQSTPSSTSSLAEAKIIALEQTVNLLQTRISKLESSPTGPAVSSGSTTKYPLYIPLGSGGQAGDKGWFSVEQYQAYIDPGQYPGYKSMQLEVNFRLVHKSGTGYARLFNYSDNSAINKSDVSTTSEVFGLYTSEGFTLTPGSKLYKMQIKSSEGVELQLESARIKVNF